MATFTKTLSGGGGNYELRLTVTTNSQSVTNNTSRLDLKLELVETSEWGMWAGGTAKWEIRSPTGTMIYSGSISGYDFRSTNRITLYDGSALFDHDADGTFSQWFYGKWTDSQYGSLGSGTASGSYTAKSIPRATEPTWSGNFEAGTAKSISLPRASSGFTHEVTATFGGVNYDIASGAGTSASWTPPMGMLAAIPNGTSGAGTIKVATWNGATYIGTESKSFTLTAPTSVVPTVSAVAWDDANATVKSQIGAYVQGVSQLVATVTASGVYGSTIKERRTRYGALLIPAGTPFISGDAGTLAITGEAVDSRGRVGSFAAPITVLAYQPAQVTAMQVRRADAAGTVSDIGTYLRLDLTAAVQSLIVAAAQKNASTIRVFTRLTGSATWTARNVITPGLSYNSNVLISGGGIYTADQAYDVRIEISDRTGYGEPSVGSGTPGVVIETGVSTGLVALDLYGNKVGVGKIWQRGAIDVGEGGAYVDGMLIAGEDLRGDATDMAALKTAGLTYSGMRFWHVTEEREYIYRGNRWRPTAWTGRISVATGTLSAIASTGNYGATIAVANIPVSLVAGERLVIRELSIGNGYGNVSPVVTSPGPFAAPGSCTVRFTQLGNSTAQNLTLQWEVIDDV